MGNNSNKEQTSKKQQQTNTAMPQQQDTHLQQHNNAPTAPEPIQTVINQQNINPLPIVPNPYPSVIQYCVGNMLDSSDESERQLNKSQIGSMLISGNQSITKPKQLDVFDYVVNTSIDRQLNNGYTRIQSNKQFQVTQIIEQNHEIMNQSQQSSRIESTIFSKPVRKESQLEVPQESSAYSVQQSHNKFNSQQNDKIEQKIISVESKNIQNQSSLITIEYNRSLLIQSSQHSEFNVEQAQCIKQQQILNSINIIIEIALQLQGYIDVFGEQPEYTIYHYNKLILAINLNGQLMKIINIYQDTQILQQAIQIVLIIVDQHNFHTSINKQICRLYKQLQDENTPPASLLECDCDNYQLEDNRLVEQYQCILEAKTGMYLDTKHTDKYDISDQIQIIMNYQSQVYSKATENAKFYKANADFQIFLSESMATLNQVDAGHLITLIGLYRQFIKDEDVIWTNKLSTYVNQNLSNPIRADTIKTTLKKFAEINLIMCQPYIMYTISCLNLYDVNSRGKQKKLLGMTDQI